MGNVLLVVAAVVCWGLWGFFNRLAQTRICAPQISLFIAATSFITIPFYLSMLRKVQFSFQWDWLGISYSLISGLCGACAGLCYTLAMKDAGVTKVLGITTAYPIITLMLTIVFLDEKITVPHVFGFLLVLAGVFCLTRW